MPGACSTTSINPSAFFAIVQLFMPQIETLPGPQDSRLQAEGSLGFPGPALEHICCHIAIVMDSGSPCLASEL